MLLNLKLKKAVEKLFGVEVVKVNTTITKGKTKRFGKTLGRRSDVKKSIRHPESWPRC